MTRSVLVVLPGRARGAELHRCLEVLERGGCACTLASPRGGAVSLEGGPAPEEELASRLARTRALAELAGEGFEGVLVLGGPRAARELADCAPLTALVRSVWDAAGVVGTLTEGVAGVWNVRLHDGGWLVSGRGITGPARRESAGDGPVPIDELARRGARFRSRRLPFGAFVHVDGQLVSGQNAASAEPLARAFLELLAMREAGWANAPGRKRRSAADAAARGAVEPRA